MDTRHEFVEQDAEGEEVGPPIHRLALQLFGRHVGGRADGEPRIGQALRRLVGIHQPCDAEVEDARLSRVIDHDVLGLQVAMDDPLIVGCGKRGGYLPG